MLHRVAAAVAAMLMLPGAATAEDRPRGGSAVVEVGLLAAIGDWLASELGFPEVAELPRVVLVPPERLSAMRFGAVPPGTLTTGERESLPDIVAFYSDAERTIDLPEGWSGATPAEASILVHEMVHHIQNVAGLSYACPEAREEPALAAQDAWLARSGSDLGSAFGIDALTLFVRTRCFY